MPTGYTAPVEDGKITTLRDYALRCARAFGACVMQREEDMDVPPRPRESDGYYEARLKESSARLLELLSMSLPQAAALEQSEREARDKSRAESVRKNIVERDRYLAMTAKVEAWSPPETLAPLKEFMLSQIHESMRFSHRLSDLQFTPAPVQSPETWLAERIASAQRDVEYHAQHAADETRRVKESKEWIESLYASLEKS